MIYLYAVKLVIISPTSFTPMCLHIHVYTFSICDDMLTKYIFFGMQHDNDINACLCIDTTYDLYFVIIGQAKTPSSSIKLYAHAPQTFSV